MTKLAIPQNGATCANKIETVGHSEPDDLRIGQPVRRFNSVNTNLHMDSNRAVRKHKRN